MVSPAKRKQLPTKCEGSWYVYMVRCHDESLYTGITVDPARRIEEHNGANGAKYTRSRQPVELVYLEKVSNRSEASKREWSIKRMSRQKKQSLYAETGLK